MQTFADGLLSASQVDKLSAGGLTAKLREQLAAAAGPGFLDDAESVSGVVAACTYQAGAHSSPLVGQAKMWQHHLRPECVHAFMHHRCWTTC